MTTKVIAACIQTNAAPEIGVNLERIEPMIRKARERGAEFITLPENVSLIVKGRDTLFALARAEGEHPAVAFFGKIARETGAWILVGSLPIACGHDRLSNRSYLFNSQGVIAARYDKIHMFDADVGENESYKESANYRGGNAAVAASTPWGKIGLTICYDMRFPHLYRTLAKAGAVIITVPAAFTVTTGKLHWHVLLRARAIETGCFIVAPAQCGTHDAGRQTYGHSLIIAPSGEIIAEAGEEPGIIMAELDLVKVADARRMLPSLKHDCEFEKPVA
jgi:predicted amidohydrolase